MTSSQWTSSRGELGASQLPSSTLDARLLSPVIPKEPLMPCGIVLAMFSALPQCLLPPCKQVAPSASLPLRVLRNTAAEEDSVPKPGCEPTIVCCPNCGIAVNQMTLNFGFP